MMFTKMLTERTTTINNRVRHPIKVAIQSLNHKRVNTAEEAREKAEDQRVK
jgi:hypothetical protein